MTDEPLVACMCRPRTVGH